jgi:HPt (histidine-containing phosphotransfer) domain-containing protein
MMTRDISEVIDLKVASQLAAHKRKGQSAFERLLPIFVEEAQMLVEQMRCAIAAADSEGLRLTAHKLKGSASVLGALQVRAHSVAIMEDAASGRMPPAEALTQVGQAVEEFREAAGTYPGR